MHSSLFCKVVWFSSDSSCSPSSKATLQTHCPSSRGVPPSPERMLRKPQSREHHGNGEAGKTLPFPGARPLRHATLVPNSVPSPPPSAEMGFCYGLSSTLKTPNKTLLCLRHWPPRLDKVSSDHSQKPLSKSNASFPPLRHQSPHFGATHSTLTFSLPNICRNQTATAMWFCLGEDGRWVLSSLEMYFPFFSVIYCSSFGTRRTYFGCEFLCGCYAGN